MSSREALSLAWHYQEVARRNPHESHFWTARSLYYGRTATRSARADQRAAGPAV
ncbi:hypothetical protein RB614_38540 [Phytohabitans sp. ZYX-F-186]|uniref:Uncharacterized protein n=1 Tax=Phytohabitans maris TaxID=3071409 RepID=A0ABU0ZTN8_9ACTN|nr:hypothetical protein [Phytohabitans sp. ZYX-F-186]MDQ7910410.1 hypothetical protein [Phytohabitans sp. ZYX-F-186]